MKDRLIRLITFYHNSGWLPAVLLGGLALVCVATLVLNLYNVVLPELYSEAKPVPFLGWVRGSLHQYLIVQGLFILFGLGFVAALINLLINRRWLKAFGSILLLGVFWLFIGVVVLTSMPFWGKLIIMIQSIDEPVEKVETQPADESPTPEGEDTP